MVRAKAKKLSTLSFVGIKMTVTLFPEGWKWKVPMHSLVRWKSTNHPVDPLVDYSISLQSNNCFFCLAGLGRYELEHIIGRRFERRRAHWLSLS